MKDLLSPHKVGLKFTAIIQIESQTHAPSDQAIEVLQQDSVGRIAIGHALVALQSAAEQEGMNARSPFAMIAGDQRGTLIRIKCEVRPGAGRIIILKVVAGMIVLVADNRQKRILRRD